MLGLIFVFTFVGSVLGLAGGLLLLWRKEWITRFSHFLLTFAAGTLLGVAFLDLIPEALKLGQEWDASIFWIVLAGLFLFFVIERFFFWHHHHEEEIEDTSPKPAGRLIVIGDTVHNFLDGVAIAVSFLVSVPLGIVTAISVFLHEIPQEVGDFSVMLHAGFSRRRVVLANLFSAFAAFAGALLAYVVGERIESFLAPILAFAAGMFIYIAGSDIIPEIHRRRKATHVAVDTLLLLLGAVMIGVLMHFLPA